MRILINREITPEIINKLKLSSYGYKVKILESILSDPETMSKLLKIKRSLKLRNEEFKISLIKAGIMNVIIAEIEVILKKEIYEIEEGKMEII